MSCSSSKKKKEAAEPRSQWDARTVWAPQRAPHVSAALMRKWQREERQLYAAPPAAHAKRASSALPVTTPAPPLRPSAHCRSTASLITFQHGCRTASWLRRSEGSPKFSIFFWMRRCRTTPTLSTGCTALRIVNVESEVTAFVGYAAGGRRERGGHAAVAAG
jgi:hypothetical protein